jgi:hypothetical protein
MDSEIVFDSLEALANRWDDLATAFRQFLDTLHPKTSTSDAALAVRVGPTDFPSPQGGTDYGLLCRCDHDDATGHPQLRGAKQAVADAIQEARDKVLLPGATSDEQLSKLLNIVIDAYSKADGGPREAKYIPTATRKAIQAAFESDDLFGTDNSKDTVEVATCRNLISDLGKFIDRRLRSFYELLDKSRIADRFDQRSIRGSIDNLSAYPLLTSDVGYRAPRPTDGGGGPATTVSLRRTVQGALGQVLGRQPRTSDTRSFLASLNQVFQATTVEERVVYTWVPRTYSGQTDLGGGVTGAQASLATRARVSLANALPLLDGLYSLREDADPDLITSTRAIIRSELTEIVEEFELEGGPRTPRVDGLFDLLLEQTFLTSTEPSDLVRGHLKLLAGEMGLNAANVNSLDEESNLTSFIALNDYVTSIFESWKTFRDGGIGTDLGTQFVSLARALSVAFEAVDEVNDAMDSVFVGMAERQVATFADPVSKGRVSVGDLLSWVQVFTSDEAPTLIHEGGRRGAQAVIPTARRLAQLIDRLLSALEIDPDLPDGLRQPRVQNPLLELKGHMIRVERLASEVKLKTKT